MAEQDVSVETEQAEVTTGGDQALEADLTEQQLRALAEILYRMIADELRIERERLGR